MGRLLLGPWLVAKMEPAGLGHPNSNPSDHDFGRLKSTGNRLDGVRV